MCIPEKAGEVWKHMARASGRLGGAGCRGVREEDREGRETGHIGAATSQGTCGLGRDQGVSSIHAIHSAHVYREPAGCQALIGCQGECSKRKCAASSWSSHSSSEVSLLTAGSP